MKKLVEVEFRFTWSLHGLKPQKLEFRNSIFGTKRGIVLSMQFSAETIQNWFH